MSRIARQSDGTYMADGQRFQTEREAFAFVEQHPKAAPESVAAPQSPGIQSFFVLLGLGLLALVSFSIGQGTNNIAALAAAVFVLTSIALYFAPTYIASARKHPSHTGIIVLNVLLGWTVLGWIIALVWAYSGGTVARDPQLERNTAQVPAAVSAAPIAAVAAAEKACPFCAETIKAAAIKCKHCGSDLGAVAPAN